LSINDMEAEPPADVTADAAVLGNEQQRLVMAALQTLPVKEREMLVLHYVLGWQMKRIAAHYGMRPNTASVKLRRALERLRHHLRDQQEIEQ
jgi:RNA polymerase sigma factor (sigma-70 family)